MGIDYRDPPLECMLCTLSLGGKPRIKTIYKTHAIYPNKEVKNANSPQVNKEANKERPVPEEDANPQVENGPSPKEPKWDPSHF